MASNKEKVRIVANFSIPYFQFLDENHKTTQDLPAFAQNPDILLHLYRQMTLTRLLDNKAVNLQRTGRLGTYPSSQGQEATFVGLGHAMHFDDIFCPDYRAQGVLLQRKVKIAEIFSIWGGDERGNCYAHNQHDLPICITVAGQYLHAAGAAFAVKYRQEKRAVVTCCGDGGTSKGDFYEALNLAGVWHLPVVFIVANNRWAISVPAAQQTAAQTLAQKGIAAGISTMQVDGNDIIAVRHVTALAIERARSGGGPTLIETLTYRLADHTTADDASRYRSKEEVKLAWKGEPIARLGYYLESQNLWSREKESQLHQECTNEIEQGVAEYLQQKPAPPTDMFDYLYEQLPDTFLDQRDELRGDN